MEGLFSRGYVREYLPYHFRSHLEDPHLNPPSEPTDTVEVVESEVDPESDSDSDCPNGGGDG